MRIKHDKQPDACIYKMKKSKNFYMEYYITIDGKRTRKQKATGTTDQTEAMRQLDEVLLVSRLVEEGKINLKQNNTKTVNQIAKQVIKELDKKTIQKTIYKDYKRKLNDIAEVYKSLDIRHLDRLKLKDYFNKPFSNTQLIISRKAFSLIFEYAEENKFIEKAPSFPPVEIKSRKDKEDYQDNIIQFLYERFNHLSQTSKSTIGRENFYLLSLFILILNKTGLRYGELIHLKNKDIYEENNDLYFFIRKSKVEKAKRKILVDQSVRFLIEKHIDKRKEYFFQRLDGVLPQFTQVFKGDKERNLKEYKKHNLSDFTLYNIRDIFIKRKIREGKDVYYIATYTGTSLEMIQKHYAANFINREYENIHSFEQDMNDFADMFNKHVFDNLEE